ncbi:hypothetical protein AAVH_06217 [Aphelenchoides avenae]|nr:hypothetical protein AAVH_06217 [Aphelenchus avenae]
MVYHELSFGDAPTDFSTRSVFLAVAPCGRRLYMLNESLVTATTTDNVPVVFRTISMCEYDMTADEITEFRIDFADEETNEKTISFYLLRSGSHAVIVTYDEEHSIVSQYRMRVDSSNATMEIVCVRRFTFRVSTVYPGGTTHSTGYIVLSGRTADDAGGVYVARLVAADPEEAARFPDIRLDKQLAELESLLRTRELFVQIFYPMLNERGIYFWTCK